jgi:hypothetical protein
VGTGLAVGLGDGLAVGLGDVVGLGDELGDGLIVGLALELTVGVGEPDAPGEIAGGVAEGVDPEQAERATEASMTKAAKTTADLARRPVPTMAVRMRRTWAALTCDGLFITGNKITRCERPREEGRSRPSSRRSPVPNALAGRFPGRRPRGIVMGKNRGKGDLLSCR